MNRIKVVVFSTCLMAAAGGAFAQSNAQNAEELRRSSEMMKPLTDAPARVTGEAPMAAPMSEADRKAEEFRKSTEMMKPQTNPPAMATNQAAMAAPVSEAERKAAEARDRSEKMKPH